MEMQGSKLSKVWLIHVDVKALTLVYVASTINGHINQYPLLDLPNSPEKKKKWISMGNIRNNNILQLQIVNTYL